MDKVPSGVASAPTAGRAPAIRARLGARGIAAVAITALVAGGIGGYVGYRTAEPNSPLLAPAPVVSIDRPDGSIPAIVEEALPSVVKVEALGDSGIVATGSAFVIREDGYLLTNNHVVKPATSGLVVVFNDGSQESATLVGTSPDYDLAVLKVDKTDLPALVLGDSDALKVGDPVIAVGAPLGLDSTVTSGIVSALHRPIPTGDGSGDVAYIDAIQTDTAINPGNSGGVLLNAAGEVIGITSAIATLGATLSGESGNIGVGFAIPSNQARRTAEEIIATGHATYPMIGVALDPTYTGEGVKVADDDPENGIEGVVAGGPAAVAGIEPGDVILAIDGRPLTEPVELIVAIRAKAVGDVVTLTVRTGDDQRDIEVKLTASQ